MHRFEAGTPAIAEAIGLGAAVDYLNAVGMEAVEQYEHELSRLLYQEVSALPGVRVLGPPPSVPMVGGCGVLQGKVAGVARQDRAGCTSGCCSRCCCCCR